VISFGAEIDVRIGCVRLQMSETFLFLNKNQAISLELKQMLIGNFEFFYLKKVILSCNSVRLCIG